MRTSRELRRYRRGDGTRIATASTSGSKYTGDGSSERWTDEAARRSSTRRQSRTQFETYEACPACTQTAS